MALHRLVIAAEAIRDAAANALRGYRDDGGFICTSHIAFLRVLDEAEATPRQFRECDLARPFKKQLACHSSLHASYARFWRFKRAYRKSAQEKHDYRPPNLAPTPNPDTKYGVYIWRR
jgi:hypothetical protein